MSYKWKAKIDKQQRKKAAAKQWMDKNYIQFSDEFRDEKWRESKEYFFICMFLISCFGLLKQQALLWTTKTMLILVFYMPVVFSKPISLVGSLLL